MLDIGKEDMKKIANEVEIEELVDFYKNHKDIFVPFSSQKERREIIKKIYNIFKFDSQPQLNTKIKFGVVNGPVVHRGISADSKEELISYINMFINGDVFYGGRASIYGTGIYTITGEDYIEARKYATAGLTSDIGIVITSVLTDDAEIITSKEVNDIRDAIFDRIRKTYEGLDNYLNVLEDDGALAAILGYDAIYVEDKKYIVVLNRSKLIVFDNQIKHDLNRIPEQKSR